MPHSNTVMESPNGMMRSGGSAPAEGALPWRIRLEESEEVPRATSATKRSVAIILSR